MTEYFELGQFFGGYMHQDWRDDYADEWAALSDFIEDDPQVADSFRHEIELLLAESLSEKELRHVVLDELGSFSMVEVRGWTYSDWLKALSDYAAKVVGQSQAS